MKHTLIICAGLALLASDPLEAGLPPAFTAHYQVLKNGDRVGKAVIRLRRDGGHWMLVTHTSAEHGLASLLGLDIDETSRFRLAGGHPEMIGYRYKLDAGIRQRQRTVEVDWQSRRVTVETGSHSYAYAAAPGMVERHLLPLVLGDYLAEGAVDVSLPVAVKDRVESQHFRSAGSETVAAPIGTLEALRVTRTDDGKAFTAWFVPDRYAMPVKLKHGDYTLLLAAYSSP